MPARTAPALPHPHPHPHPHPFSPESGAASWQVCVPFSGNSGETNQNWLRSNDSSRRSQRRAWAWPTPKTRFHRPSCVIVFLHVRSVGLFWRRAARSSRAAPVGRDLVVGAFESSSSSSSLSVICVLPLARRSRPAPDAALRESVEQRCPPQGAAGDVP